MLSKIKTRCITALLCSGTMMSAQADFFGVDVGAGYWHANFGGTVIADVTLADELHLDTSNSTFVADDLDIKADTKIDGWFFNLTGHF